MSSISYFNKKNIKLNWQWSALKVATISFWIFSVIAIHNTAFSINLTNITFILLNMFSLIFFISTFKTTSKLTFDNIFTDRAPENIVTYGPYKWVRHPYYTSYMLTYSSVLLVDQNAILVFLILVIFALYFFATADEETKILSSDQGRTYADYRSRTKKFIPYIF